MVHFHEPFDPCQGHIVGYVKSTENVSMPNPKLVCLHSIGFERYVKKMRDG